MNKVWEIVFDVFIGILIMFISVAVYFGLRTETVMKSMYESMTDEFVANVKKNGILTLEDYEDYIERMGIGNELFNVILEHGYKIQEPEYRFKSLEEIIEDQNNAYTGSNEYHYREVITERPHVDDPINNGNLNTDTNESVLANAVDTPPDSNHTHEDDRKIIIGIGANEKDIYYSNDGQAWNKVYTADQSITNVTYGRGIFIAASSFNCIYISEDGINWHKITTKILDYTMNFRYIVYANNYFYALGTSAGVNNRTCYIMKSSNGTNWVSEGTLYQYADNSPRGIGYSIHSNGDFYLYAAADVFYRTYKINTDGSLTPGGYVFKNYISDFTQVEDGIYFNDYSERSNKYDAYFIINNLSRAYYVQRFGDIQYGNGMYLQITNNLKKAYDDLEFTTITNHNLTIPSSKSNLIYANDMFMFAGNESPSNSKIYSSVDGVTWKSVSTPVFLKYIASKTTVYDCYKGTKHVHSGNSSSGGGCYGEYISGGTCGKSLTYSGFNRGDISFECGDDDCLGTCKGWYYDEFYECSDGHTTNRSLVWTWACDVCDNNFTAPVDSIPIRCGRQVPGSYGLNCNKVEGKYYDSNGNELGPICGQTVVSITPTHPIQTVYVNDPLITTAIATYKDGSSQTVVCTTEFSTAVIGGDKAFTLIYNYSIDEEAYNKTCEATVTVIPRSNTCPKGHIYNLNEDGTDPGCPYCREWVESLMIINPTTSPIEITIGTTLQDNNIKLLATYMDGHTEEVTSGYIDNFDIGYLGTKVVTIGYKGLTISVPVKTVCATMLCDICGYEYDLYPDGSNPGCPRCIQKIPVFTESIMEYEHINHTEEILDILYIKKKYVFNLDDVFSVSVSNKSPTMARNLLRKIYPSLSNKWINIKKRVHVMSK